jgi:malate permease and related proteins
MSALQINLLKLYIPLVIWVGLGLILGHKLPKVIPFYLGKSLFWLGVPLSIVVFLRQADLSGAVWTAPLVAWAAIALGAGLGWLWIKRQTLGRTQPPGNAAVRTATAPSGWNKPTQGSFLLAAMVGNTGYLGYPVTLALVGTQYFAWAIFYDTLGSTLGAYGLGVALAARFGMTAPNQQQLFWAVLNNPALWSFGFGLGFRNVSLPLLVEQGLRACAWTVVALSLLLLGMRLSQLRSWGNLGKAAISLTIKMLIVPLCLGFSLPWLGIHGFPRLVLVLQMGMSPAFATLVLAEAYDLDRDLTVTALALGSIGLLLMLPIWLWLFTP